MVSDKITIQSGYEASGNLGGAYVSLEDHEKAIAALKRQLMEAQKQVKNYDLLLRQIPDTIRTSTWELEYFRERVALFMGRTIEAMREEYIDATIAAAPSPSQSQQPEP